MVWYDSLILFGVGDPSTLHKDNIDIKLVPSIVEKVVVPKINGRINFCFLLNVFILPIFILLFRSLDLANLLSYFYIFYLDYVTEVWDPMSTQQTSRLVNLVGRIIKDYPTINDSSKQTQVRGS